MNRLVSVSSQVNTPMNSPITTHVLDTSTGLPGVGISLKLEKLNSNLEVDALIKEGTTNNDGRCPGLMTAPLVPGSYKMTFFTKEYYARTGAKCFYPKVEIFFDIENVNQHYHIPLLIAPYGFSTYRGS